MREVTERYLIRNFLMEALNPMITGDKFDRIYLAIPVEHRILFAAEMKDQAIKKWMIQKEEAEAELEEIGVFDDAEDDSDE